MNQLFRLAWRNIGRKPRRSLTAMAGVALAILLSVSLRSLMLGNYDKMNEAGTKNVGHLQVHQSGYWADKSINDLLLDSPAERRRLGQVTGVKNVFVRLQNGALAAGENTTKAVQINGIEPETEESFTRLSRRLSRGTYLTNKATGVVLAEGLARYLKLAVGDTLVLIGQGYHATLAGAKYPVLGTLALPNPQQNLTQVYMPIRLAQAFYSAPDMATSYLLTLTDIDQTPAVQRTLRHQLGPSLEVMRWDELLPEIRNSQRVDTTIFTLLSSCLYLIIGMGLIGTVLMMTLERRREWATLTAVGMSKSRIGWLIVVESLVLGLLGILLGLAVTVPFVLYMNTHPIPMSGSSAKSFEAMGVEPVLQLGVKPHLFGLMSLVVLFIMLLATLLPIRLVRNLPLNEALKS